MPFSRFKVSPLIRILELYYSSIPERKLPHGEAFWKKLIELCDLPWPDFSHAITQERTSGVRTLLDQFPASAHAILTEFSDQLDRRSPCAHSVREENAWAIEQFITLAVSDSRSATDAIDTMLADRSSWCQPLSSCFCGFVAQLLSSPAFAHRYWIAIRPFISRHRTAFKQESC